MTTQIRDCAAHLSAQSRSGAEAGDDDFAALMPMLQSLGALYTMAEEREVHAKFLPPGMEPVSTAVTPDEDDDGLF